VIPISTRFDAVLTARLLAARGLGLGLPLTAQATVGSTNDLALTAARAQGEHGAVFVAEAQTRGRGRQGRSWVSPPGENLTFSVLLRPRLSAERAQNLTLLAGLAVREATAARVAPAVLVIKWPNDVVCQGRKLAGILVESVTVGTRLVAAVIGIGINVTSTKLSEELDEIATSLALLGAQNLGREALLVDVLAALEQRLDLLVECGPEGLVDELRGQDALRGQWVRVGETVGIASGIDATGALLVRDAQGGEHRIASGTVEACRQADE
jgi:BirA family biotin operon repressor/biotin-[acetyl-CoA-carboxylase] ligase